MLFSINVPKLHTKQLCRASTPNPNTHTLAIFAHPEYKKPNDYDFFVFHASSLHRFIWREHVGNHC